MISTIKPTPVTVGGAQWPVLFAFRGWYALTESHGDIDGVLDAAKRGDQAMAAEYLHAGLLWDNPDLTPEAVTAVLDEGTLAELEALPLALVQAMQASQPKRRGDDGGGDPWDWDVAIAVWVTEWGQDPDAFWSLTFADFAAFSNGRSKLYAKAQGDGGNREPVDVDPRELIRTQRIGRGGNRG